MQSDGKKGRRVRRMGDGGAQGEMCAEALEPRLQKTGNHA